MNKLQVKNGKLEVKNVKNDVKKPTPKRRKRNSPKFTALD